MKTSVMKASQLLALASAASSAAATAEAQARLTVEGTEFVLDVGDGRTLRSAELVGATLVVNMRGRDVALTIANVEADLHAIGGPVLLHRFVVAEPVGHRGDMCAPDTEKLSQGFPVADGYGGFELTCTIGAIGKCVRWGYRPSEERPGGVPMRALHEACTHMVRADYGGDGRANTHDGTAIDVCDRYGVRKCDERAPFAFEAAWGRSGATCVARPRIAGLVSLDQLAVTRSRSASRTTA